MNIRAGANGLPTVVTAFLEISAAIPEVAPDMWSAFCLTALLTPEKAIIQKELNENKELSESKDLNLQNCAEPEVTWPF